MATTSRTRIGGGMTGVGRNRTDRLVCPGAPSSRASLFVQQRWASIAGLEVSSPPSLAAITRTKAEFATSERSKAALSGQIGAIGIVPTDASQYQTEQPNGRRNALEGTMTMEHKVTRRSLAALSALPLALLGFPALGEALGEDVAPEMSGTPRLAIGGYDTVAYHTVGKAVPGRLEYQTIWHAARWQFSSQENLDLFTKDPEKYAAQYDGHCAMGVAYGEGHKDNVDPEAFTIVNGKLYINHTKYWATEWRKNAPAYISQADKNWLKVAATPEPGK